MKFELRKLKSEDMFLMFGILSKIGFKDLKELITVEKMKAMMSTFNGDEAEDADMTAMLGMVYHHGCGWNHHEKPSFLQE